MTDTEKKTINTAIAEAMGWQQDITGLWFPPGKRVSSDYTFAETDAPRYCSSLDLMAQAEAALTFNERERYADILNDDVWNDFEWITRSAAQRAEAFCRVRRIGPYKP